MPHRPGDLAASLEWSPGQPSNRIREACVEGAAQDFEQGKRIEEEEADAIAVVEMAMGPESSDPLSPAPRAEADRQS